MSYGLGIDLGTTYTAAAISRGGRPEVVTLSYRATSIPTVVVLAEDGTFVVGDPAERRGAAAPERLAREFKRRVGDPTPLLLGGTPVSIDRLLAEVLTFVHRTVSANEGGPPDSTVVTHPANWGPFKRDVLVQALRLAGIEDVGLLPEPVAAATWYARAERLAPGATVAVYDLGGGTFDTVVLQMGADGSFAVRGQPEGVERLGGVDVDAAVMGHVLRVLGPAATALVPEEPATVVAMNQLQRDCVEAKEALSAETTVTIPVLLPNLRDQVLLQRRELEELIAPLLVPTTRALARVVASAQLGPGQPDAVLLVGGASRTPLVAREVTEALGRPVAVDAHPKHPVALGAALVAAARVPATASAPVAAPVRVPAGAAGPLRPADSRPGPAPDGWRPPSPPPAPGTATPVPGMRPPSPPPPAPRPGPGAGGSRTTRRALVAVAVALVLVAVAVAATRLGDGGGVGRNTTGTTAGAGPTGSTAPPLRPRPGAGARQAWKVSLGEQTITEPATDGEHVFMLDGTGRLSAISVASGTVEWQVKVGDQSLGSPVVAGDVVVASVANPDLVQALDKATGAVRWTAPGMALFKKPVVVGDTVVAPGVDGIVALALADGKVRWQTPLDDMQVWTGLVPAGDTLVAGTSDGRVLGVAGKTGKVRFVTPVPRGDVTIWSVAVVGRTALAYDDDADVTGISVDTGEMLWTLDANAQFPGAMAALGRDAVIWLSTGDLLVVDPATGRERRRLHDGARALLDLPGDPPLLVLGGGGSLRALRPDGRQAWTTGLPIQAQTMAFAHGILAVADYDGNVGGYRVKT